MAAVVLDSSAVLAVINQEPGMDIVLHAMLAGEAIISAVNVAEIIAKLVDWGASPAAARAAFGRLSLETPAVDAALAIRSGELRAGTRSAGLSLGDRMCLALAEREGCPALTADRIWASLNIGVAVEVIR